MERGVVVAAGELHVSRVVGNVHEGGVDQLGVDRVLGALIDPPRPGIEVVDH